MSEAKDVVLEKCRQAMELGADPNIPISEAASQVMGSVRQELNAATSYMRARKQRKAIVADRLKAVRKEKGLKQQDVAELTGIHVITLSGYEIGKNEPNIEAMIRLADAYGVSLDYLMCRDIKAN